VRIAVRRRTAILHSSIPSPQRAFVGDPPEDSGNTESARLAAKKPQGPVAGRLAEALARRPPAGGDLSNAFKGTLFAPGTDIQLLAGPTLTANKSFQDININPDTIQSGQTAFTRASSTSDPRALQRATSGNIAACRYTNTSMTIHINIADGNLHDISLYGLDWDSLARSERIDIIDPSNGNVLSTQTLSNFASGEYLTWKVGGHVQIKITNLDSSANAVLSGLFFGPAT
jgi:hypothetical protein